MGIVTDSTCDLPEEVISKNNIHVIPLLVSFGEKVYKDREELSADDFYTKLKQEKILPRTSQPAVGEFVQLYEKLSSKYDSIISLHLSSRLSGTYDSARLAAEHVEKCDIHTIDTRSVSLGLGFLAILAAKLRNNDYPPHMIKNIITETRKNISIYFTVNSLEYLEKGGRIGKARALIGSLFNINPVLEIIDGEVTPLEKLRGKKKTFHRIKQLLEEELNNSNQAWVGILTGKAGREVEYSSKLYNYVKNMDKKVKLINSLLGPVIGTHTGPEIYGTVIYKETN
ncbi:MAG: DegV family protein [Halanaerobiales bacterium]